MKRRDFKVWIDIDNPPQVQYLVPFEAAFRRYGAEVVITARDYGNALALLEPRTACFYAVGKEFGGSSLSKVAGVIRRAHTLKSLLDRTGRPDVLICASRSSALAARRLGIPSFVIGDYEYANSSFYRLTGSSILYPDVIDPARFLASHLRREQLIPFHGLKEDISMAGINVVSVAAHHFAEIDDDALVRVLFRPPAETSHYYEPASREFALHALEYLASRPEAVVVFSPRHPWQQNDLARFSWANEPIVLARPVPFISLLKGVDAVVSSGGTMLREAAYLGLPAYSIFKSPLGAVDRHLASIGRLRIISSTADFPRIELRKAPALSPLRSNPNLLDDLVEIVLQHTQAGDVVRHQR